MDKNSITDKIKEGVSPQQIEDFARKHTPEVFTTLAIFIATISSIFDFFTGSGWALTFIAAGTITAIAFPLLTDGKMKKVYDFCLKQDKTTEMVLGGVQVVIAIFLPFLYFGYLGLLAGTAYHHYVRHGQVAAKSVSPTEHLGSDHD